AFFITTSIAAASLVVPLDRSSEALSYRAAAVSFGTLLAPPIAGYISDIWGFSLAFKIAILTSIVNAVLCSLYRNNLGKPSEEHLRDISWKDAFNRIVIFTTLLAIFGGGVFSAFRSLLQTHYSDLGYPGSYYGLVMAMFSGITTLVRLIVPKLIGKDPSRSYLLALLGYILILIATSLLFVMYKYPNSFVVTAIYGVGFGLTVPTIQHLISYYTERGVRNRAMAIYAIGFDIGGFVGGLTFSYVAELYTYTNAYLVMTSFPIINVFLMLLYMLKYKVKEKSS
ncbi:MAG TPA: MFS transporter, partial [Euryarchaeota archaeon]|nr:MFS transporter [Euryarchaeota archaeon]